MSNTKHSTQRGDEHLMWVCLTVDRLWAERVSAPIVSFAGIRATTSYVKQQPRDVGRDVAVA